MPDYVAKTPEVVDTGTFYWTSRLIGALADSHYPSAIQLIERYQRACAAKGHELLNQFDEKMMEAKDFSEKEKDNEAIAKAFEKESDKALRSVLMNAMREMKNGYNRADN